MSWEADETLSMQTHIFISLICYRLQCTKSQLHFVLFKILYYHVYVCFSLQSVCLDGAFRRTNRAFINICLHTVFHQSQVVYRVHACSSELCSVSPLAVWLIILLIKIIHDTRSPFDSHGKVPPLSKSWIKCLFSIRGGSHLWPDDTERLQLACILLKSLQQALTRSIFAPQREHNKKSCSNNVTIIRCVLCYETCHNMLMCWCRFLLLVSKVLSCCQKWVWECFDCYHVSQHICECQFLFGLEHSAQVPCNKGCYCTDGVDVMTHKRHQKQ